MGFKSKALSWSLAGLLLALPIVILVGMRHRAEINPYFLEMDLQGVVPVGQLRLDFDLGKGVKPTSLTRTWPSSETPTTCSFPLPGGPQLHCQGFNLHVDTGQMIGNFVFKSVRVVDVNGQTVLNVPAQSLHLVQPGVPSQVFGDDVLVVQGAYTANVFDVKIDLAAPLALPEYDDSMAYSVRAGLVIWILSTVLVALLALCFRRRATAPDSGWTRVWAWTTGHPHTAIVLVGLAAVVASCYPVVFAGSSFVSPNLGQGSYLLYPSFPTVPGSQGTEMVSARNSDVYAMCWYFRPISTVQHRAVFDNGEFPFWNRYLGLGTPLLGQGFSMIFDPLHWIPVAGNGAAWAWDLKFLIAKTLLAIGLGCLVFSVTRFLPASLVIAASSVFIGFFLVRLNHPEFFSFCYAPWVLLAWIRIIQAATARQRWPWMLVLAVFTVMCLNSGTVKAGYLLCAAMHLMGVLALLLDSRPWRDRLKLLGLMTLLGVAILMITAPSYLTFFETMNKSMCPYDTPRVGNIFPGAAIGFYDGVYYDMMSAAHGIGNPSVNLLMFLGLAWLAARPSAFRQNRFLAALAVGAGAAFAVAFGLVPDAVILAVPFIKNIYHVGIEFSEICAIFVFVLAGCGMKIFWQRCTEPGWLVDYLIVLTILLVLTGIFMPSLALCGMPLWLDGGTGVIAIVGLISVALLPVVARFLISGRLVAAPVVVILILCLLGLHARCGMQVKSGIAPLDALVFTPPERPDYSVPSPAVESLPNPCTQPFRAVGLGATMFPGFNAALGIESIFGSEPFYGTGYGELVSGFGFERANIWSCLFTPELLQKHAPDLDFWNVRYVLAPHAWAAGVPGGIVRTSADLDVLERPTAWPRAFFTDRLLDYQTVSDFVGLVKDDKGRPFAAIQKGEAPTTVSHAVSAADREARLVVPATGYRLTCNTTTFTVEASKAGVAVLSEQFYPDDFQVTVNGRPASYFRVNHAFKGVVLDGPGTYTIGFTYRPKVWPLCLALLAGGLVLLTALVVWQRRSRVALAGSSLSPEASPSLDGTRAAKKAVQDNGAARNRKRVP